MYSYACTNVIWEAKLAIIKRDHKTLSDLGRTIRKERNTLWALNDWD